MPGRPVYLDNHATTRVDPRVLEAMLPFFAERYGNAASVNHAWGWDAAEAVEAARAQLASLMNVPPNGIVFTSGATEANNLALKGVLAAARRPAHLITTAAEHRSVLDPSDRLKRAGFDVTVLPVDEFARADPAQVADAIRPETVLVSVILANNEVGTINPLEEIGRVCRERSVLLHVDAVQALGKLPLDFGTLPVDLASVTAHKLHGPKGVGALYVRRGGRRIRLEPLLDGGGHERHLRSGTLPVPLVVGFGAACELAGQCLREEASRVGELRDRLWSGLCSALDGLVLNGHPADRLPGNLNVSFEGVDGEALMTGLTRIAVSSGSACTTADPEPSHVLRAMGRGDFLTRASLRFGLGRFNTSADVETAVEEVAAVVRRLRS
ncbi:MAG TPA: cysteine desulfurase family protein [Planctomycetaceae bacterium]|nr:cysteine desulfurase family protein [Planctomycetaceae bacterium]